MDRQLRSEIIQTVANAMKTYNEKWVTAEELQQHVGTLTPRFMKDHGDLFKEMRTRVEWTDADGERHAQAWLYPLYEIKEMVINGKIKDLKVE